MFGDFLNNNQLVEPWDFHSLVPGTPIVTYCQEWGGFMQFGIFVSMDEIYYQKFLSDNSVMICRCDMRFFYVNGKCSIYEYQPRFKFDNEYAVALARANYGSTIPGLHSIFGDDFVIYCLTGNIVYDSVNNSIIGYHFVEDRRKVLKYTHHAIGIEEGKIIHFSYNNETSRLSINLETFGKLNSPRHKLYDNEDFQNRLDSRNRALLALTGYVHIKNYNLITNNCEHFATWCKTGKRKSLQVEHAFTDSVWIAMMIAAKRPAPALSRIVKRYLFKY